MPSTYTSIIQQIIDTIPNFLPASFWEYGDPFRQSLQNLLNPHASSTHTVKVSGLGIEGGYLSINDLQELLPINEKGQIIVREKITESANLTTSIPATSKISGPPTHTVQKFKNIYYKLITLSPKGRLDTTGANIYFTHAANSTVDTSTQYWHDCVAYQFGAKKPTVTSILIFEATFAHGQVNYIVQPSREIPGISLQTYCLKHTKDFAQIEIENLDSLYMASLFTTESDGKPDNYIAETTGTKTIILTSIDSDQCDYFPFMLSVDNHLLLKENTVTFLLPQAKTIVSEQLRQKFLAHSPTWYTLHMLDDMLKFSDAIRTCYPALQREPPGFANCLDDFPPLIAGSLPPQVDRDLGKNFEATLKKTYSCLGKNWRVTYEELLKEIKPLTYYAYQQASLKWFTLNWLIELAQTDKPSPVNLEHLRASDAALAGKIENLLPHLRQAIIEKNQQGQELTHYYLYSKFKKEELLPTVHRLQATLIDLLKEAHKEMQLDISAIYREYIYPSFAKLSLEELFGPTLLAEPQINAALQQARHQIATYKKAQRANNLQAFENPNAASIVEAISHYVCDLDLYSVPRLERPMLAALLMSFYKQHAIPLPQGFQLLHLAIWVGDLELVMQLINNKRRNSTMLTKTGESPWDIVIKSEQVSVFSSLFKSLSPEPKSHDNAILSPKPIYHSSTPLPILQSLHNSTSLSDEAWLIYCGHKKTGPNAGSKLPPTKVRLGLQ